MCYIVSMPNKAKRHKRTDLMTCAMKVPGGFACTSIIDQMLSCLGVCFLYKQDSMNESCGLFGKLITADNCRS